MKSPKSWRKGSGTLVYTSLNDLSKVASGVLVNEEDAESFDGNESSTTFEEMPGAWSGGIDLDEDDENPGNSIEILAEQSRHRLVVAFVFSILTLIGTLFLIASLLNGGLPRYGVEQAEKIVVFYDETDVFEGELKRDGNWKYYRFQTHHEVENITVDVKAIQSDSGTYVPPLAVYLHADMVPTDAVDVNGTSILQGTSKPGNTELDGLLHDSIIACGPRTIYIGVTLPYWTPATASLQAIHYELRVYREVPKSTDNLCESERLRASIFIYFLQPVAVFVCIVSCFVYLIWGLATHHKLKKLTKFEIDEFGIIQQVS